MSRGTGLAPLCHVHILVDFRNQKSYNVSMDVKVHLLERGLNPDLYTVSWDDETACFALWNLSGQWVGYQQYRPFASKTCRNDPREGRYFTWAKNRLAVWGLETWDFRPDVLFLTEGVFDACKLHNLGLPAVAVLANDPKSLRPWLGSLARRTVAVCDDDAAGAKLGRLCDRSVTTQGGKDLGDMTQDQVREFVSKLFPNLLRNNYE